MFINLTNDSVDHINFSKEVKIIKNQLWSGGEIDFRIDSNQKAWYGQEDEANIIVRLNSSDSIMRLFMAAGSVKKANVYAPYLPYARQDRICNRGEPFSLKILANLFNSTNIQSIKVFDVHSEVSELLFNNLTNIPNWVFVMNVLHRSMNNIPDLDSSKICLVSPDAGAQKKIFKLAECLGYNKVLSCFKHRSSIDGAIETVYIPQDKLDPDLHYFIVDDICDGGRTFVALGEALREKGARNLHLVVSHGIFSGGLIRLRDAGFGENIWTTTSISTMFRAGITPDHIFNVWDYLL